MISEEDIKNIKEDLEIIRNTQTKGVYNSYRIDQAIEYINQLEDKIEELETERDYYKQRHLEFNNAFIERKLDRDNTCLHCGNGKPDYCEKCFQELILKNLKLQNRT